MAVGYVEPLGVAADLDSLETAIAAKPRISAAAQIIDVPEGMNGRMAVKVTGTAVADIVGVAEATTRVVDLDDATGGTFDITVDGQTAAANDYDITTGDLKTAIEGLSSVSGTVSITGDGSSADPFVIVFADPTEGLVVTVDGASLTGGGGSETCSSPVANIQVLEGTTPA